MTAEENEKLAADLEWLRALGEQVDTGEELLVSTEDEARPRQAARWLGFALAHVEATLKEQGGTPRLIVEMRERLLVSGRKLTAAVAHLAMARRQQDAALVLAAREQLRAIADSDEVPFHREVARDFLALEESGPL